MVWAIHIRLNQCAWQEWYWPSIPGNVRTDGKCAVLQNWCFTISELSGQFPRNLITAQILQLAETWLLVIVCVADMSVTAMCYIQRPDCLSLYVLQTCQSQQCAVYSDLIACNVFNSGPLKEECPKFDNVKMVDSVEGLYTAQLKKGLTWKIIIFKLWRLLSKECNFFFATFRIYANILRIFFLEFSEEKLGCAHYLKQGWYCSASKQNDPVTH